MCHLLHQITTSLLSVYITHLGGGGGEYSYIRVLLDEFLLKSVVFKFISKYISRARTYEYSPLPPPPLINALVSPLRILLRGLPFSTHK